MSEKNGVLEEQTPQTLSSSVKEGFMEPFRMMGFGVNTKWGRVRRWFFGAQFLMAVVLLPLGAYDMVGLETHNNRVEVLTVVPAKASLLQEYFDPAVELRFVDGTRGGQVISRSVPNSNSYAVGEQFDMTYQVGRLTGNVIVKDLEE